MSTSTQRNFRVINPVKERGPGGKLQIDGSWEGQYSEKVTFVLRSEGREKAKNVKRCRKTFQDKELQGQGSEMRGAGMLKEVSVVKFFMFAYGFPSLTFGLG